MARRIRARAWQAGIELYGVQTTEEAAAALERLNELGLLRHVVSPLRGLIGYQIK
jgi:hypothetical protein